MYIAGGVGVLVKVSLLEIINVYLLNPNARAFSVFRWETKRVKKCGIFVFGIYVL